MTQTAVAAGDARRRRHQRRQGPHDERRLDDRRSGARPVRRARRHGRRERRRHRVADRARCDRASSCCSAGSTMEPQRAARGGDPARRRATVFNAAQAIARAPRHGHDGASRASSSIRSARSSRTSAIAARTCCATAALQTLTRDHTIVEELVDRGLLSAEEAERHPYKNVLSRNLGAKPETRVDVVEVELKPGDRLMLCSDGLYGYASAEAIQYLLGSGDAPEHVARDLIDLALRGGGGDNVTTIVIEAPQPRADRRRRSCARTARSRGGSAAQRFLQVAKERGLTRNPIVRGLDPERGARADRALAVPGDLPRPREVDRRERVDVRAEPRRRLVRARRRVGAAARADGHPRRRARAPSSTRSRVADAKLGFLLDRRGVARARRRGARARWPARGAAAPGRRRADQGPRGDAGDDRSASAIDTSQRHRARGHRRSLHRQPDGAVPAPRSPGHELRASARS